MFDKTTETVVMIIADQLKCSISLDDNLVDLGADILDLVEIHMSLEEEFGYEISDYDDPEVVKLQIVRGLVEYVKSRI